MNVKHISLEHRTKTNDAITTGWRLGVKKNESKFDPGGKVWWKIDANIAGVDLLPLQSYMAKVINIFHNSSHQNQMFITPRSLSFENNTNFPNLV